MYRLPGAACLMYASMSAGCATLTVASAADTNRAVVDKGGVTRDTTPDAEHRVSRECSGLLHVEHDGQPVELRNKGPAGG